VKSKVKMGPQTWLPVEPVVLVGTNIGGKANFATVAWTGIAGSEPPMVSIALRHIRYTLKGIYKNRTFSVNIPSADLVKETDYCGIISGENTDKVKDCGFTIFYGNLDTAPLIEQCPINMECEVVHVLNVGSHALVIGKIIETHISGDYMTDGKPDFMKIDPLVYIPRPVAEYRAVGKFVADTFSIGKELK